MWIHHVLIICVEPTVCLLKHYIAFVGFTLASLTPEMDMIRLFKKIFVVTWRVLNCSHLLLI